jgi:hypothetical protein
MHPDDFEKFAESLKKKAVRNPSEENVKEYYEVQEIARKKALAFTKCPGIHRAGAEDQGGHQSPDRGDVPLDGVRVQASPRLQQPPCGG